MKYEIIYKVIRLIDQDVRECRDSLVKYDLMGLVHSLYAVASRQRETRQESSYWESERGRVYLDILQRESVGFAKMLQEDTIWSTQAVSHLKRKCKEAVSVGELVAFRQELDKIIQKKEQSGDAETV